MTEQNRFRTVNGSAAYRSGYRMAELLMMPPNRKTCPNHAPKEFEELLNGYNAARQALKDSTQ